MVETKSPADAAQYNDSTLKALSRAIAFSQGEFSLVIVRCNYQGLQQQMLQRLKALCQPQYQITEFIIPPSATTLYTTIQNYEHRELGRGEDKGIGRCEHRESSSPINPSSPDSLTSSPPHSALLIVGLESVVALEELLTSTNQVRDEFRKRLTFPLILWVNDQVLQKLMRLAPDFGSWAATPLKFELTTTELVNFLGQKAQMVFACLLNSGEPSPSSTQEIPNPNLQPTNIQPSNIQHSNLQPSNLQPTNLQPTNLQPSNLQPTNQPSTNLQHSNLQPPNLQPPNLQPTNPDICITYSRNSALQNQRRFELDFALKDLHSRGITLDKELDASLEFVLGLDDYRSDRINLAKKRFRKSLKVWQQTDNLERQGLLLFYLGLCYCRQADQNQAHKQRYWEEAWPYLHQSMGIFTQAGRHDLVAIFISKLAELLQHLQAWSFLQTTSQQALSLHETYGTQVQLAQDYGFLAEVALEQSRWDDAGQLAEKALLILVVAADDQPHDQGLHPLLLAQLYRLFLVKSQGKQGNLAEAVKQLEKASHKLADAIESSNYRYEPQRYLHLLERLRSLYFEQGQYLEAFRIKQEQRAVEQLYGFRAFIGASRLQPPRGANNPSWHGVQPQDLIPQEMAASGRQRDVNRLMERITRADHKLTVIHGQSGVGKSSIVHAGLVPALKNRPLGDRIGLPIVVQVYTDWVGELHKHLADQLLGNGNEDPLLREKFLNSNGNALIDSVLEQLQHNADNNLLTVLIFDQFEEFFSVYSHQSQRKLFYYFLVNCLKLPYLKLIFSIRDNALHKLLELEHYTWDVIESNILDKKIRYPLVNFSLEDAYSVIQSLTHRANFYLEPALIDELVRELGAEIGEVRPIELQVVGAQLQAENITTLAQYQHLGPKAKLVERFLEKVIKDCGPENETAAWLVLSLLIDDNKNRPLKNRSELAIESSLEDHTLDLILEIFEKSGLVFLLPEVTINRYQLVHDYLVDVIRQKKQSKLQAELENLRQKDKQSQDKIEQLVKEQELQNQLAKITKKQRKTEEKLNRILRQRLREARWAGMALFSLMVITGILGVRYAISKTNNHLSDLSYSSKALVDANRTLDALILSLEAAQELQQSLGVNPETQTRVVTALQQAVYGVRERNRLKGHRDWVSSVSFSPDGKLIASGSRDKTIKLWRKNGTLLKTLRGHWAGIHSVSFSQDGQIIASGSEDKTVKLWRKDGSLVMTLDGPDGHTKTVHCVRFSADSEMIASASEDKTIKLWSKDGVLLQTLTGHSDSVLGVSISPNGQLIASASKDKTIKLWRSDGTLVKTWQAHTQPVVSVSFSPDGKTIASASTDNTVKLWHTDGELIDTLEGHRNWVLDVSFSSDGQRLATASADHTIKLWNSDGELIETLAGHSEMVLDVSFSPDNKTIASASADKTIRLWASDGGILAPIRHNQTVRSVSFSPDGEMIATASADNTIQLLRLQDRTIKAFSAHGQGLTGISFSPDSTIMASASEDKTVKLWNLDGSLLHTLEGHQDQVWGVSFSPDSKLIASASADKTVKLWNLDGTLFKTLEGHQDKVWGVSFSPDSKQIASASNDGTVKLWNRDGKLLNTLKEHNDAVNWVSFSPDGEMIASASSDGTVKLWNRDGKLLNTLKGHNGAVNWVSFSPDGTLIASASSDTTVNLWSRDGHLINTFKGHNDSVFGVSFSPDSKLIASASKDKTMILWNLDVDYLLRRGCSWLYDYWHHNREGQRDKLCGF
ncbi:nSTAND1 domain-containing NTPase [Moorena bouillonii]|uniref:Novel STAND NTPase 1 domain-containing protein n=1 Tax=Moorena bouillonii PNG TaxID=568701 RepID=A0A1U7MWN5_9CYAN|nr:hypothetical protein [Moorena bouillonii]OLT58074.1 hypothetical protein BJP37_02460 [Moorena bouillonii PNG]